MNSNWPCSNHQKQWRADVHTEELCVDIGLLDKWLETMNSLHAWAVYSTCEGHAKPPQQGAGHSDCPRIWFHGSAAVDAKLVRHWDIIEELMRLEACRLFDEDITEIELFRDLNIQTSLQSVFLHLKYRTPRRSTDMERDTVEWFERVIGGLMEFDRVTKNLLEREEGRPETN